MAWGASLGVAVLADNVDRTSYSTASWTPTANRLILVFVVYSVASGGSVAPSLSGNGITWTEIRTVSGGDDGISLFAGLSGASPSTGALTASFGAITQLNGDIHVISVDGADITGTAADAVVQSAGSTTGSTSPQTIDLTDAPRATSRCFSGWITSSNQALTPRTNWTELGDAGHATPSRRVETQWRSDASEQTASLSGWTGSVFMREIVVEIASVPPTLPLPGRRPSPWRAAALHRGRRFDVPVAPVVPTNPEFVFMGSQRRVLRAALRRGRRFDPLFINAFPNTSYLQTVLADSPSGMWKLDEPSGTVAKDSSGNGHDGTIEGAPTLGIVGALGPAFAFAAVNTQRVRIPFGSWMVCSQMSIEFWIRSSAAVGGNVVVRDGGGSARAWVTAGPAVGPVGTMFAYANNQFGPTEHGNARFDNDEWHHFVAVIDGPGGTVDFYKDGALDVQRTGGSDFEASTVDLTIGADTLGNASCAMKLQMVAFYPGIKLTAAQVAEHWAAAVLQGPHRVPRRRRSGVRLARQRPAAVVPAAQAPPANPALTFGRPQPRKIFGSVRRSKPIVVVDGQSSPPAPAERRTARGWLRRGKPTNVVPTQVAPTNPPIVLSVPQRRIVRGWRRRSKPVEVVPAQVTQVNPAFVFARSQRRTQRGWRLRRGRAAQPVPAQVIQINPSLPGNTTRRRRVFGWFLRRRQPRTPIITIGPSILDAPTPTSVAGPDGRGRVAGPSGASMVAGPDGRSTVAGPTGSTIVE